MTTYEYKGRICVEVVDDSVFDQIPNCTHLSDTRTGEVFYNVPNTDFIAAPRRRPDDKLRRRLFDRPDLPVAR